MPTPYGDLDLSTVNRIRDELLSAGRRFTEKINLQTQLTQQAAEKKVAQQSLEALTNVYSKPKATPEEVMNAAMQAHKDLAPYTGAYATAAKSNIDKMTDIYTKFKVQKPSAPHLIWRNPGGSPKASLITQDGVQMRQEEAYDVMTGQTHGMRTVPHNVPSSATKKGMTATELKNRQHTVEIPILNPDPNKREQETFKTEKYTAQPEQVGQRLVFEANKIEKALEPYTKMTGAEGGEEGGTALDLNQYLDSGKTPDPYGKDLLRIPYGARKSVVAMIKTWQNLITQARQYATAGFGANKPDISSFESAQATAPKAGPAAAEEGGDTITQPPEAPAPDGSGDGDNISPDAIQDFTEIDGKKYVQINGEWYEQPQ